MSLLLWLGVWLAAAVALAEERRYAVVVGNNQGDAAEQRLRFAERDAERVAEVLRTLGGIQTTDLVLLKGGDAQEVRSALAQLAQRIAQDRAAGQDGSRLFFYYSGHADANDLHLGGSRLPLAELKRTIEDSPADVRLVVVDACRAGELTRLKGGVPVAPFVIAIDEGAAWEGTAIITSAAQGEDAQESDRLEGGVFTHHVLAGLQGAADTSGDGRVTLQEAYNYSNEQTKMTTSRAPVMQHPAFRNNLRGQGELFLTALEGARRTGLLALTEPGEYVVFDPKGSDLFAEFEVPAGARVALPAGRYLVRRRTPDHIYQTSIEITEGRITALQAEEMQTLAYGQAARRGYSDEDQSALAVLSGASAATPLRYGFSTTPSAFVGLRLERPELSLQVRARYSLTGYDNEILSARVQGAGLDAGAFKLFDPTPFLAAGLGVRGGVERLSQQFTTAGSAPDIVSWAGHIGIVPRAELKLGARWSLGLEGGASTWFLPADDDSPRPVDAEFVLYGGLDLSFFLF